MDKKDKHYWNFKGANLTKRDTKIVVLTVLFGVLGSSVAVLLPFEKSKLVGSAIAVCFALIGYILATKHV